MIEVKSYLQDRWIGGSDAGADVLDAATGEVIARASTTGLDLAAGLEHARSVGGPALRALSFAQRGEILDRLAQVIHGVRQELIDVSTRNYGATRGDAKFDIDGGTATLAAYAEIGATLGDRRYLLDGEGLQLGRSPRFWGQHVKLPRRGVAIHINAFNFPVWGFAEKFACAFLAGMPVLTKPATGTVLPAHRMAEEIVTSGVLPAGSWSFLGGGAGDLLEHVGSQDAIAFTGSAATGYRIRGAPRVIENSVPVNVEADSLNAMVVGPDVEVGSEAWKLFLFELAREMTQKAGQKCTATRRVFVPEDKITAAIEELGERLGEIRVGDPSRDDKVRMGPLATPQQRRDVIAGLRKLETVAERVYGEDPGAAEGLAPIAPTVLLCREPETADLVHELEVFGPIVTVMPYDGSAATAARLVARGGGGLVAAVYTDDLEFSRECVEEIGPYHGRLLLGGRRIAEHSTGPGLVLPSMVHGGPGRAGGGCELGGLRGLNLYLQTCAVQGARPVLDRILS